MACWLPKTHTVTGVRPITEPKLPALRLPVMGPLTEATLFFDFSRERIPQEFDWDQEVQLIINHRLASVAQRMIVDLGTSVPEIAARQLQDATFAWTQESCIASSRAVHDLAALHEAHVDYVVTKGPGIATHARRLSDRPFTDIDIIVAKKDFDNAVSILNGFGYSEEDRNILPWKSMNQYCREAINLRSPSGGSIDVHHHIPPWYWGNHIDFSEILDRAQPVVVPGGGELVCASPTDNLLISALHIVSDKNSPGSTLMAWRDCLLLAQVCDPVDVVMRARRTRLGGWLTWIFESLPSQVRPRQLLEALDGADHAILGRRRLSMSIPPGMSSNHVISQVLRLPTPNAALYLAGMAWPSSEFLRTKYGAKGNQRWRWWRGG